MIVVVLLSFPAQLRYPPGGLKKNICQYGALIWNQVEETRHCLPGTHFISNKVDAVQANSVEIMIPREEVG
jgi:hypothetical protein